MTANVYEAVLDRARRDCEAKAEKTARLNAARRLEFEVEMLTLIHRERRAEARRQQGNKDRWPELGL